MPQKNESGRHGEHTVASRTAPLCKFKLKEKGLKIKTVTNFIILLFLLGCSSNVQLVDQAGRDYPEPNYFLQSTQKPIAVLYYFTIYKDEIDLDGTKIPIPKNLSIHEKIALNGNNYSALVMTIEVQNPKEEVYELWEQIDLKNKKGIQWSHGRMVGKSNRKYRAYRFWLPYGPEYKNVKQSLYMVGENQQLLLHCGFLTYSID